MTIVNRQEMFPGHLKWLISFENWYTGMYPFQGTSPEVQIASRCPDLACHLPSRVVEGRTNRTSPIPRETPIFKVPENSDLQFPEPP